MALPAAFEQRMQRLLGEEYPAFRDALARPQARGLRVSPLKIAPEQFAAQAPFTLTPVPWAPEGFFYPDTQRPGRHPYYEAGVYYIQEPSAMAVGALADAKPGERVLDLCAAPGGKTTHLAGRMHGEGLLVANEIHAGRAAILAQSIERMGVQNCIVCNETPERLAQRFPEFFDCIVVDAPCSGEGMFRKDDNPAQSEWTPELPSFCAARQAEILDRAADMLAGGGRLIYSTCTFAPEEDEGTLSRFLERHPEFSVQQVPTPEKLSPAHPEWAENGNPDTRYAFRLWPHKLDGEGHFAAVLHKNTGGRCDAPVLQETYSKKEREQLQTAEQMIAELVKQLPEGRLVLRKDKLWLLPEACQLDVTGLKIKRMGIEIGTLKKNRLEPAHALAHALASEYFLQVCNLSAADGSAEAYLRGETFPYDGQKGWTAVAADGFVMGWGKCAGGTMKNHYPKGLRWVGK